MERGFSCSASSDSFVYAISNHPMIWIISISFEVAITCQTVRLPGDIGKSKLRNEWHMDRSPNGICQQEWFRVHNAIWSAGGLIIFHDHTRWQILLAAYCRPNDISKKPNISIFTLQVAVSGQRSLALNAVLKEKTWDISCMETISITLAVVVSSLLFNWCSTIKHGLC